MNTLKSYSLVSKYHSTIKATKTLFVEIGQRIYKVSFNHFIVPKKKKISQNIKRKEHTRGT